jgi:hypothetical protein
MPDLSDRRRAVGRILGVVAVLLTVAALVAVGPGIASAAGPAVLAAGTCPPADAADQDAVTSVAVACLQAGSDHLALIGESRYSAALFTDQIDRARAHRVALWVVVLGAEVGKGEQAAKDGAGTVAEGVQHQVGGTVVVVTPDYFGIASDELSQSDLAKARDAVSAGDGPQVVATIVDSLTAKAFPWLLAVTATIAVLVLGAFAGGLWTRRRRRHADQEALVDLTGGLAARVGDLAPTIVSITDEVDIVGRPDLEDRFAQATGDYNDLRERLAAPLPNRAAVNEAAARVQALTDSLAAIRSEVTAALGRATGPEEPGLPTTP